MLQTKDFRVPSFRIGETALKILALEAGVFRTILKEGTSLAQALAIVLLGAVASAVGMLDDSGISTFAPTVIIAVFGWVVWSWLIYVLGTHLPARVFPKSATPKMRSVFIVIGFAQVPAILRAVGIVSSLGPMIAILSLIWIIAAMAVGTNQLFATKSLARSAIVVLISLIPYLMIVGGFTLLTTS